ncbi:MAG: hypothetical protein QM682_12295 [Paracoccus sp. (in: a-proteobacteria)]|uniref:hypothetical protein n=1 Tax=Paracoccus sp. TaxID=267 RepID=UPI0039E71239
MFYRAFSIFLAAGVLTASAAHAECSGSNGRGWASAQGNGKFQMAPGDASCLIGYPSFINGTKKTPATQVKLTRAPKSGKIALSPRGLIYTPAAGFKGTDKFCTSNSAAGMPGTLKGCVSVTVP